MARLIVALSILILMSACNLGVPQVTPTVAPTYTPTADQSETEIALQPTRTPVPVVTDTLAPTVTATITPLPTNTATLTATLTFTPNPSETPTDTPTITPSPTDTATLTLTATNTPTLTPSNTATPNPSQTPTLTPTNTATHTLTPTATPSLTFTPSATFTPTFTLTPTATLTPMPLLIPTDTPSPTLTPSDTPTITATATSTFTPLPPTVDPTEIARQVFATATAFVETLRAQTQEAQPTFTPSITATAPAPTLDATPTYVTAPPGGPTPAEDLGIITPLPATETVEVFVPTSTPIPVPTAGIAQPAPSRTPFRNLPTFGINTFFVGSIDFSIGPANLTGVPAGLAQSSQVNLVPGMATRLFARSPANPNNYVLTDGAGNLYTYDVNGGFRPFTYPFHANAPTSLAANRQFVREVAWAPNGSRFAFIIDGDLHGGGAVDDDGVYYREWATGEMRRLVADCPYPEHRGCYWGGERGFNYQSVGLEWSPNSSVLLVNVDVTRWFPEWDATGQRKGALLVVPTWQDSGTQPPTFLYDYGSWMWDGRLVVSGMNPSGTVMIGTINSDGSNEQILFNASAAGWWVQDAVQRPNGQIVALGRPGDRYGPMQMINQNGQPITGPIGWGQPSRVRWSSDRSAVLVQAGGGTFIARIDGTVQDITGTVQPGSVVDWLQ